MPTVEGSILGKSFCIRKAVNTNQENISRLAWKDDDRCLKGIDIQYHSVRQIWLAILSDKVSCHVSEDRVCIRFGS